MRRNERVAVEGRKVDDRGGGEIGTWWEKKDRDGGYSRKILRRKIKENMEGVARLMVKR